MATKINGSINTHKKKRKKVSEELSDLKITILENNLKNKFIKIHFNKIYFNHYNEEVPFFLQSVKEGMNSY